MKKTIFSVIAASVIMFFIAEFYTGAFARAYLDAHLDPALIRTPPNLILVFFGYFVLALLMSIVYRRFVWANSTSRWTGLRFGLAAAVFWLMPYSLVLFGVYNVSYDILPLAFIWALIEQGVGGLVIGLIYGKASSAA